MTFGETRHRHAKPQRGRTMMTVNMIAFGVVLFVGMYGLTAVLLRKQQPPRHSLP
jgi:hypothetical protein